MNRNGVYRDHWKELVAAEKTRRVEHDEATNDQAGRTEKRPTSRRVTASNVPLGLIERCRGLVRRYPRRSLAGSFCVFAVCVLVVFVLRAPPGRGMMVPVSGVVSLNGQPIANVVVHFQPVSGAAADPMFSPSSHGITDGEGRYKLEWSDGSGAIVGEHVVTLMYKDPNERWPDDFVDEKGNERPVEFKLPFEARDGTLRFTVPQGGTGQADFAFESGPDVELSNQ